MRGPGEEVDAGDLWVAATGGGPATALTSGGGYRSPIFSPADGSIVALNGETLVRIPAGGGAAAPVQRVTGVLKLVWFDARDSDEIVVLLDGGAAPLGVLSVKSGKVTPLPHDAKSDTERRMLAQVRGQERTYADAAVYVKTEAKRGLSRTIEWTDVYLRRGSSPPQNVSASRLSSSVRTSGIPLQYYQPGSGSDAVPGRVTGASRATRPGARASPGHRDVASRSRWKLVT